MVELRDDAKAEMMAAWKVNTSAELWVEMTDQWRVVMMAKS